MKRPAAIIPYKFSLFGYVAGAFQRRGYHATSLCVTHPYGVSLHFPGRGNVLPPPHHSGEGGRM